MDRTRPAYNTQKSVTGHPGAPTSPMMPHSHVRSGSTGMANARRAQNNAAKAAAERLAQVMAHQQADDDDGDDEDELDLDYSLVSGTGSIGLAGGRAMRSRPPMTVRTVQEPPSSRVPSGGRSASTINSFVQPQSARSTGGGRQALPVSTLEQPSSAYSTSVRTSQSMSSLEQPPSAQFNISYPHSSVNELF
ncbi:coiled-coil domain-containing protein SCD2-like [Quillaja saponaria]|uniref:Coiled-coil domain-containing protein SCD2-like n=1 Tax=Quillaja saponaria TaxID=32244 RepID=A0AAD7QAZ4_QUISA|nr:coiled-coil domain-containing protein SCD2-like [Quillaja saponaria]